MNLPVYMLDFDNLIFHLVCIFWLNDMKIEILAIYIKTSTSTKTCTCKQTREKTK